MLLPVASFFFQSTVYSWAAVIFVVLAGLLGSASYRLVQRWKKATLWQRAFHIVITACCASLFGAFIWNASGDPMFAPRYVWAIWQIERRGGLVSVDELRSQSVYVTFSDPRIGDAELRYLTPFRRLRMLELIGTSVTDAGVACLKDFPDLLHLSFIQNQLTDRAVADLKHLEQLESLELFESRMSDEARKSIQEVLPKCRIEPKPSARDDGLERPHGLGRGRETSSTLYSSFLRFVSVARIRLLHVRTIVAGLRRTPAEKTGAQWGRCFMFA